MTDILESHKGRSIGIEHFRVTGAIPQRGMNSSAPKGIG